MSLYNRLNPTNPITGETRTPRVAAEVRTPQPRIPEWRRRAIARVEADGGNLAVTDLTGGVTL